MQAGRTGNKKTEKADSESPNMGKSESSLRKPEETEGQPGEAKAVRKLRKQSAKGQISQKAKKAVRKKTKQDKNLRRNAAENRSLGIHEKLEKNGSSNIAGLCCSH